MAILIDENTKYMIQGITGKQGSRACEMMLSFGSKVVCGVTPGKGGQIVNSIKVFNGVKEAIDEVGKIDCTVIYVPPRFAKSAIVEAINCAIPLINVITENIPVHDMAYCFALLEKKKKETGVDIRILGGSSVGIYSVGKSKCGSIASSIKGDKAFSYDSEIGRVGVISRSGGMSQESALVLTQTGISQSTVVGIGSDILMGSDFLDLIKLYEQDEETDGILIFGEIGGGSEERLAEYLISRLKGKILGGEFTKPIVAFISGEFASGEFFGKAFKNISLGHAGAIIEGGKGGRKNKVKALKEAGVIVANVHHEVGELMKKAILSKKEILDRKN